MFMPFPTLRPSGPLVAGGCQILGLYLSDFYRFWAFIALGNVKLNAVAFIKALESVTLDFREVHEYVLSPILSNKTKSLLVLEPLHCSLCHGVKLFLSIMASVDHYSPCSCNLSLFDETRLIDSQRNEFHRRITPSTVSFNE